VQTFCAVLRIKKLSLERLKLLSRHVALAAALSFDPSSAYAASDDHVSETVVVEGTRPEIVRRVNTFVTGITHRGYAVESLARWNGPICPLVAGVPSAQGEFILQRLSDTARAAGAPLGPPKCRPNLHVVLTPEPDQLLALWRKRAPRLFGGQPPAKVRRVLGKPRPIRVWYNAWESCSKGGVAAIPGADINFGLQNPPGGNCSLRDSRLIFSAVNVISSVIVLVDLDDTKDVKLGALTDYIAMVGMAEVNLDGDWGDAPTILQLFADSGDSTPQRMSAWDQAFLNALYNTSQNSRWQRSAITQSMVRDFVGR
jgi:hypothetical protein